MKSRSGHQKRRKRPKGKGYRREMAVKVSSSLATLRALSERYAYGDPVSLQSQRPARASIGHATAPYVGSDASVDPSPCVQEGELRIVSEFA